LGTSAEILRERPDVVLLDVNMPALSGDQLLRVIRDSSLARQDWEPQFIFVSANDATTLERLVKETGAFGAIEKSGGPEAIVSGFRDLLGV
jgi:DNA-binding NarL/FixJ family response regulator